MVKRILLSLAAGLLAAGIAAMGWNLAQVGQQREGLIQSVLRLHIVADSDDPQDQAVKLAVRDALVSEYGQTLSQAESLEQAPRAGGPLAAPDAGHRPANRRRTGLHPSHYRRGGGAVLPGGEL